MVTHGEERGSGQVPEVMVRVSMQDPGGGCRGGQVE